MRGARGTSELGNSADGKSDVGASEDHGVHEAADGFPVWNRGWKREIVGAKHSLERHVCVSWGADCVSLVQVEPGENVGDVASLIDEYGVRERVAMYLETNIVVHWTMCYFEGGLKMVDDGIEICLCRGTNYTVVDEYPDDEIDRVGRGEAVIHTGIGVTCGKVI